MNIAGLYEHFRDFPEVCIDSRNVTPDSVFFALKGPHFDGNRFASDALDKGCSLAIVTDVSKKNDPRFMVVPDVLHTLQELASYHRGTLKIPVVAITGSNGKTTTKELIRTMLAQTRTVVATEGNLNNHIGLPLTLLRMTNKTETGVVEMGANHLYEIRHLCNIARPTHGLITNIGHAHIEGFGSFENVIRAKGELYEWLAGHAGTIFRNSENPFLSGIPTGQAQVVDYTVIDGMFTDMQAHPYFQASWSDGGKLYRVSTNLYGSFNAENIAAAITVARYFDVPPEDIQSALAGYMPENHRSQIIRTEYNTVIMDSYNANPSSMIPSLTDFIDMPGKKKMAILGDMFELGSESRDAHARVVDLVRKVSGMEVIFIGAEFYRAAEGSPFRRFENVEDAMEYLQGQSFRNTHVLMKGSRAMALEKLLPAL